MSGFPNNFYELVQQLLRVNRRGTTIPGENTCEIHVDFYSYISLFMHIMSCDSADEPRIQLAQLHEVLKFLLLSEFCYHTAIERKFEWTPDAGKTECAHDCSKCRGDVKNFAKWVNKERQQSLITTKVQGAADKVPAREFLKVLKLERKTIFHRDDVPSVAKSKSNTCSVSADDCRRTAGAESQGRHKGRHGKIERSAFVRGVSQREIFQGRKHSVCAGVLER